MFKLLKIALLATFVTVIGLTQIVQAASWNRADYNVVVDSGSNSLVGTVAVQLDGTTTSGYTKAVIWEDTGAATLTVYLGDTDAVSYTVPAGSRETLDFIPPDSSSGYYVATTITTGVQVNFIGTKSR